MEKFFVYIDDSGSPGQAPANKFLVPDTKIWAGVILSLEDKEFIDTIIESAKIKLQEKLQFSEFHFTDIYSGRNDFKGVDSQLRLEIFELFVELYNKIKPYIVVTCAGRGTLENSGFSERYISTKVDSFNYSNPSDYSLHTLILIINEYFEENYKEDNIEVEVIIDEGRQNVNTTQKLTSISGCCKELNYKSSKDVYGLQFIDFIAFYINRTQNNYSKERTNFDNEFMKIVGNLQLNSNLKMFTVSDLDKLDKDTVESFLATQEGASIESIQYIEELSSCISRIRDCVLKKSSDFDKREVLDDIKRLKQLHFNRMSDEFKIILDEAEYRLSDKCE
ncbi:TPA: DUF3800 domain-containing protein [Clostridium perfringens]